MKANRTVYSLFNMEDTQKYNLSGIEDPEYLRGWMLKAIGKNIRNLRLKRKMTQEQVAEMAGINPKYLGEIERGEKNPTVVVIQKLSVVLNAPICELLTTRGCPRFDKELIAEIAKLLDGQKEPDQRKALRLLRVFFE